MRSAFAGGLGATVAAKNEDGSIVLAFDRGGADLLAALERGGAVPLPPYIRGRRGRRADRADYQTMFAAHDGAVAAPTAGLHFTPELLAALEARRHRARRRHAACRRRHLPAGAGRRHRRSITMHAEMGRGHRQPARAVERTRAAGGRVVAVGTTSLRLLETGGRATDGRMRRLDRRDRHLHHAGLSLPAVDLLLTNFHLPRSTLFMLVSAFAGLERMKAAYAHAIASGYRFYSYGDCCLLRRAA